MKTYFVFSFICFLLFPVLFLRAESPGQKELPPIDLSRVKINRLPYKFVVTRTFPNVNKYMKESFSPVNLNGDGSDKLLRQVLHADGSITHSYIVVEGVHPQAVKFQTNFYGSGGIIISNFCFDVNKDGKKEIFLSEIRSDSTYLHIIDSEGKILDSFLCASASSKTRKEWDAHVNAWAVMDINGDGWQDLLFSLEATYSYQPRGVYALDVHHKKFLWKYRTGFPPRTLILYDIDGDGKREILLGSASPANGSGVRVNGTDDVHTYLVVLDSLGHCLRKPQVIGGEFAVIHLFAHDLDGDGKKEILAVFWSHKVPKENSLIAVWDPVTGNFGPRIDMAKDPPSNLSFLDADKDGKDDVLVGWSDGTVEFRNYNLETITSRKFTRFYPLQSAVTDFNNDGKKEIVVSGEFRGRGVILILDRKMHLLAYLNRNLQIPFNCIVSPGFGKNKLLLAAGPAGTFVMSLEKQFAVIHRISWNWLAYGLLLGVLLSGFSFVLFVTKKSQKSINTTMESLFDLLRVGLMALDSNGNIISSNSTMEQLLKRNRKLMIGTNYKKFFAGTSLKEIAGFIKSSYQGKPVSIEKEITTLKDGVPLNLLVNITLFSYGNANGSGRVVSVRNITDVVDSKRVVAWAGMAQKLAHEIKTPLSTLMLSAQRLQMEREKNSSGGSQSEKYLQYIIDQIHRLRNMTDDFLKFARIEKPRLESANINQIITESLKDFRLKIGSKVQVKKYFADNLPNVFVDKAQLIIAIQNLISNSLTAMSSEGVLTITTRLVQKLRRDYYRNLSDFVQIEISDTGKGISQEDLDQLFQPFFSRSAGGTGMGLVIVKKIIEDHKGTIEIESEERIGTTVFVTIPFKEA